MATLPHNVLRTDVFVFETFFCPPVSGSIDNKRKLRATPQWRYLKLVPEGNGIQRGKHVFVCVCMCYVCQHSAKGVI